MAVERRPEHLHVPRLLRREEIARTPQVEISCADRNSRTGLGELRDNLQALTAPAGLTVGQKICKAANAAAPYSSSKLVQLSQPELLRPADDDCICAGNIQPALDNICRQPHI